MKRNGNFIKGVYTFVLAPPGLGSVAGTPRSGSTDYFMLDDREWAWWEEQSNINKKKYKLKNINDKIAQYNAIKAAGPVIDLTDSDGTLSQRPFIDLVYNVGSVQEAYLSTRQSFQDALLSIGKLNSPSAITNASQLWVNGANNKGMIQPYTKLAIQSNLVTEVTLPSADDKIGFKTKKTNPTGFQFLYNPATVEMVYNGVIGVDVNFETNGLDQFNMAGVYSQSTIGFSILINRMFDFTYYDPKTGLIDTKYKNVKKLYYPRQPEESEQRDIYKKGTMYDVEHLLRAVLGFSTPSYLGRNMSDGQTADMGFISGMPVELHLGTSLRYLGNITALKVTHVLFDERMVPIFTNLSVSFARLVDPIDSYKVDIPTKDPKKP
jgi:hypothetical protein